MTIAHRFAECAERCGEREWLTLLNDQAPLRRSHQPQEKWRCERCVGGEDDHARCIAVIAESIACEQIGE
jgi:hypothetical protein